MLAQRDALVKQRTRALYLQAEGAKAKMKVAASEQGRQLQTVDRVDLALQLKAKVRKVWKPRRGGRRHRKGAKAAETEGTNLKIEGENLSKYHKPP